MELRDIDRALYKKMRGWEWYDEDDDDLEDEGENDGEGGHEEGDGDDMLPKDQTFEDDQEEEKASALDQKERRHREAEEKARMDKLLGNDLRRNRKEDVNFLPSSASKAGKSPLMTDGEPTGHVQRGVKLSHRDSSATPWWRKNTDAASSKVPTAAAPVMAQSRSTRLA